MVSSQVSIATAVPNSQHIDFNSIYFLTAHIRCNQLAIRLAFCNFFWEGAMQTVPQGHCGLQAMRGWSQ
jgi:hypothetical protein